MLAPTNAIAVAVSAHSLPCMLCLCPSNLTHMQSRPTSGFEMWGRSNRWHLFAPPSLSLCHCICWIRAPGPLKDHIRAPSAFFKEYRKDQESFFLIIHNCAPIHPCFLFGMLRARITDQSLPLVRLYLMGSSNMGARKMASSSACCL